MLAASPRMRDPPSKRQPPCMDLRTAASVTPALKLRVAVPASAEELPAPPTAAAAQRAPCNRRRWGCLAGLCALAIAAAVACGLLLVSARAQAMRQRLYLTVTVDVPATSMSSDLGSALHCDAAATLWNAQPPVAFGDISMLSFTLMQQLAEVEIASDDVRGPSLGHGPEGLHTRARVWAEPVCTPQPLPYPPPLPSPLPTLVACVFPSSP